MSTQNDIEDTSSSKATAADATTGDNNDGVNTENKIPSEAETTTTTMMMTIQLTLTALPGAPRVPLELPSSTSDSASSLTSSALRQLVSTKTNIPLSALRLIYRGRLITDNTNDTATNVITEYKLENGSVLHCMGKPLATTETKQEAAKQTPSTVTTTATSAPAATATPAIAATTVTAASTQSSSSSSVPSLQSAVETMRASNSAINYTKCIKTLQKVLSNIIDHPLEEKYRTIKVNNAAFQKHFHHVHNSTTVLLACGFQRIHENTENAAYTMNASPEQWPTLLQSKSTIDRAVQQSTATNTAGAATTGLGSAARASSTASTIPLPFPPVGGGMMPDPSVLQQSVANFMSNPEQIQAMMQDPMIQNMIRNDPQLANIPHLQQAMDAMMNNPQVAEGMRQMMSDPNYQRMLSSPEYMQSVQQRLQQSMNGTSVNDPPPLFPPNLFTSPPVQQQPSLSTPWGPTATTTTAPTATSNNATTTRNPTRSDDELTEEEMIAEAIRRSLQDNNNNGP